MEDYARRLAAAFHEFFNLCHRMPPSKDEMRAADAICDMEDENLAWFEAFDKVSLTWPVRGARKMIDMRDNAATVANHMSVILKGGN